MFALVILSLNLVLATTLEFNVTSLTGTVVAGESLNIPFKIVNGNGAGNNLTDITSSFTNLLSGSTFISSSVQSLTNVPSLIQDTQEATVNYVVSVPTSAVAGTYTGNLTVDGLTNSQNAISEQVIPISIVVQAQPAQDFCDYNNDAGLKIKSIQLDVLDGFGDDENYWYPLDEVEIEFKVDNTGDWDVSDIELEICVYDENEGECVYDEGDMDLSDDNFNLDKGDDLKVTATFTVDPDQLREGNNDYTVHITATGRIDDRDAGSLDDEDSCTSDSQDIEIRTTDRFVIIANPRVTDLTELANENEAYCGSDIELTLDLWNIGDQDLKSSKVFVWLYNKELGINRQIDFKEINSMDYETLTEMFTLPTNIQSKTYPIEVSIYDDSDYADNDLYENDEKDEAVYNAYLKVDCSAQTTQVKPTITAVLESDAQVGQDLVVKITAANPLASTQFIVTLDDYSSWSEFATVDESILTIAKDQSKSTTATLKPTKEGSQSFTIKVAYNGQVVEQPVQVNIAARQGVFAGLTGAFSGTGANVTTYLLIGIVILVVVIIIVLIVKLASGSRREEEY